MSAPRRPGGLGRAGAGLWDQMCGAVAENWKLDGRDLELLARACKLADVEADLRADVVEHGRMTTGSAGQLIVNPALREARQTALAVASLLSKVELKPKVLTGRMSKRQRDQLRDARAARWGR